MSSENIDYTKTGWINDLNKVRLVELLKKVNIEFDGKSNIEQLRKLLRTHIREVQELEKQRELQRREDRDVNGDKSTKENESESETSKFVHTMSEDKGSKLEFVLGKDDWETYIERLDLYFVANDVKAEKQVAVLLTKISPETYKLVRDLCAPNKPNTKTYKELTEMIQNHLNPKPSEAMERYKFNQARQSQTESVADFVARLKRLSLYCNFTDVNNAVRDQIVCGLKDHATKKALFREAALTFDKAYTIATQMETAENDVTTIEKSQGAAMSTSENSIQWTNQRRCGPHEQRYSKRGRRYKKNSSNKNAQRSLNTKGQNSTVAASRLIKCYCCGKDNHMARDCRYRFQSCKTCSKKGHLAVVCRAQKTKVQHLQAETTQKQRREREDDDTYEDFA